MMHPEIAKLAKYLSALYPEIEEAPYARQLNMLYGALYAMGPVSPAMFHELIEIEESRIDDYGASIAYEIENAAMLVTEYSEIAFNLAQRSLDEDKVYAVASGLQELVVQLLATDLIPADIRQELRATVSETVLDFVYAAGNHNISSLRMAHVIQGKR